MGPTVCEPLVTLVPLHPPPAVQLVAFVALQVSVVDPPLTTLVGFAVKDTTGGGEAGATCRTSTAFTQASLDTVVNTRFSVASEVTRHHVMPAESAGVP